MKVVVAGLWHLGTVVAACCASSGHDVIAFDEESVVKKVGAGELPVEEPGLRELIASATRDGRLRFTSCANETSGCDVLWICYDTPVDENDVADIEIVKRKTRELLNVLTAARVVVISAQLPVGSTAQFERDYPLLRFVYSPENLRLGKAIEVFTNPDRVVAGVRDPLVKHTVARLFAPFTDNIEWMSIESAEMTKHALNAFLATSISFINEIASICEQTGADAQEVERGLKTDVRIGERAYLHAGMAFAGGTLARDISYLLSTADAHGRPAYLLRGVIDSNASHKAWVRRRIVDILKDLQGKRVAVLGLTYKPGTNTLRRSSSVEICRWLCEQGAEVRAFDPAIGPAVDVIEGVQIVSSASGALTGADAALIATPWQDFRSIPTSAFKSMRRCAVIDPVRHLEKLLRPDPSIEYFSIGVGS